MKGSQLPKKRTLLAVLLFILAGAIINVAVAWGCAFRTVDSDKRAQITQCSDDDLAWLQRFSNRNDSPSCVTYSICGLQEKWFGCGYFKQPMGPHVNGSTPVDTDSLLEIIRFWKAPSHIRAGGRLDVDCAVQVSAGWPHQSLCAEKWFSKFSPKEDYFRWGVGIPANGVTIPYGLRLPLKPLWPGFAINTIFYAAILWLMFTAPGFVRRRIRIKRGLCPACAYPVGASDVCTECGPAVKRHLSPST